MLILGAVGGWLWWNGRTAAEREAAGENLLAVAGQLSSNQTAAAGPQIDALVQSDVEGYRAAGLFARATAQSQSGDNRAAIATLRQIGDDQSLNQVYRDAALVRRTQLEFDSLQPQEVIRRLNGLATGGGAWTGAAGELVGVAHLKMNRPDLAGPLFVRIARDPNAPATLRQRAGLMAGSLGFDPDPNAPRSTAPASPAAPATSPAARAASPPPAANAAAPAQAPATREKAR